MPRRGGTVGGLAFPNAATTGPAAAGYTMLTPQTAANINTAPYPSWVTVQSDGSLLVQGCSFTSVINVGAENVIFRGCQFTTDGFYAINPTGSGNNLTFEYCQISGNSLTDGLTYGCNGADNLTVIGCNLFWFQEQPILSGGNNCVITGNYVHDYSPTPSGHYEPLYVGGVSPGNYTTAGWVVTGNTFHCEIGNNSTAAIFMNGAHGQNFSNMTFQGNLLSGGAYTFYCGQEPTYTVAGLVIRNNWFSTKYASTGGAFGYATSAPTWNSDGNLWTGNRWYDGPSAGSLLAAP